MDFSSAVIEFKPENGSAPWVCLIPMGESIIWFAHRTEADASAWLEKKRSTGERRNEAGGII